MKLVTDTGDAATTTSTKVGNRSVSVRFDDGSSESELGTGGVVFVFDRASGALKTLNGAEANTASPKFTVSKAAPDGRLRLFRSQAGYQLVNNCFGVG